MDKQTPPIEVQNILKRGLQRNEVFDVIPEGASRILDIGYGDGCLLMRLIFEKQCTECCGVEIREVTEALKPHLKDVWSMDLMEEDLPDEYLGYFDWIILHDVLEHVYDPWNFLGTVNKYLSDKGRAIIVCPNAQYWEVPYALLNGNWPLSSHGFWNEDHVRWFTFKTLSEVAIMAGFGVENAYLQYPQLVNSHAKQYEKIMATQDQSLIEMPLLDFPAGHMEDGLPFVSPTWSPDQENSLKLMMPKPNSEIFPYLMAIKIMLVCQKRSDPTLFRLHPTLLRGIRQRFYEELGDEELKKRYPKNVQVQVIRK